MSLGGEQVDLSDATWKALDTAEHDEFHRSTVGLGQDDGG
jgi:hypothetical protein